jgi:hypothetical protein
MSEIAILAGLLLVAFVLAPVMTNRFFFDRSRIYLAGHQLSLLLLALAFFLNVRWLFLAWPLFCVFGFLLYLRRDFKSLFSVRGLAIGIPFVFSLISATWFTAGIFDLQLLGYNTTWSFYAAIHGSYIGWIFVGCLAFLAKRKSTDKIYLSGCYFAFLCFLLVAFGIDGTRYIKPVGVIGLSLITILLIGRYAFGLTKENRLSVNLASLSLVSVVLSMALALLNHFWADFPKMAYGVPVMVITHGILNSLLALPCFFLAINLEQRS